MKNFILGMLFVAMLAGVGFYFYQLGNKKTSLPIETADMLNPPITDIQTTGTMVGNDKDEHGCIGSAGYSWCESKNKCLRVFEEGCPSSDDPALIREALKGKNHWDGTLEFTVDISYNDGKYAKGTVAAQGGGGYFYAQKDNGQWVIVADGNGLIMCPSLEKYPDYPKTLIPECWDEKTQTNIQRK